MPCGSSHKTLVFDSVTTAFDNVWLARRVGHDAYSWELVSFMDMACVSFVQRSRMPLVASLFPMCSHSRRSRVRIISMTSGSLLCG